MDLNTLSPLELATLFHRLEGSFFLDSSGYLPEGHSPPFSLFSAQPTSLIKGNIHSPKDRGFLQTLLEKNAQPAGDPYPLGGLFGWIGYEGDFCLGVYPQTLIYTHANHQWVASSQNVFEQFLQAPLPPKKPPFIPPSSWETSLSQAAYTRGVQCLLDFIQAGDIYQANLTQRFRAQLKDCELFSLYKHLRHYSPAPMAAWAQLDQTTLLSSSPELFLKIDNRSIQTRPIKGTSPRYKDIHQDKLSQQFLKNSSKENAELLMITDMERNDLGQVATIGSVRVDGLATLESYPQVHHLVSTVSAQLQENVSHPEALAACFPGGSITGAPKKRAREIIAELEPCPRGIYTGALGYFGWNGVSQWNIVIRTLIASGGMLDYQVGAGIVAQSIPQKEYEETLLKAEGIRQALHAAACLL